VVDIIPVVFLEVIGMSGDTHPISTTINSSIDIVKA
jgi:hypothetical protein